MARVIRKGLIASDDMLALMKALLELGADQRLVKVAAHKNTVRALVRRDWIVNSTKVGGMMLTGRGIKALRELDTPGKRMDGICPRCGERPREGGSYCLPCRLAYARERRAKSGLTGNRPDRPCRLCGQPRYVSPNGYVASLCIVCSGRRSREYKWHVRRQINGEMKMCRCGRGPLAISKSGMAYDTCRECQREINRRHYLNRKRRNMLAKVRRT